MKQITPLRKLCYFFVFILLICTWHQGNSQEQIFNIQDLDLLDGFQSKTINNFLQDSSGEIWIVTSKGLISYDGTRVRDFTSHSTISKRPVQGIGEDDLGNIWVLNGEYDSTLDKPVSIFVKQIGEFIPLEEYLLESSEFSTKSLGVGALFNGTNVFINSSSYFNRHVLEYHVLELRDKKMSSLFKFNMNVRPTHRPFGYWKHSDNSYAILVSPIFPTDAINKKSYILNFDRKGRLLGEYEIDSSFPFFQKKYFSKIDYLKFIQSNKDVETFAKNMSNLLSSPDIEGEAIGVIDEHLVFFNTDKNFQYYDAYNFKYIKTVKNLYRENLQSQKWFLDGNYGLWTQDQNSILRLSIGESQFVKIFDIDENEYDRENRGLTHRGGEIYFVENAKLKKYKEERIEYANKLFDSLFVADVRFTGLMVADDKLYASTERHGLGVYSFGSGEPKVFDFADSTYRFVWQSYVDDSGQIWVGSEGLFKVDQERAELILAKEGDFGQLKDIVFYHFEDSEEGTWLCASDGLYLVNLQEQKIIAHYGAQKEGDFYIPVEHCLHMHKDKDGIIWIATKGQGVVKWNRNAKEYKSYTIENIGFSSDIVYAVYPDDFGNLWMPSYEGLMRFNKKSEAVSIFTEEQGLPNNEFNTISHFKDSAGLLYFGSISGLIRFDPGDFESKKSDDGNLIVQSAISRDRKTGEKNNILKKLNDENVIDIFTDNLVVDLEISMPNFERDKGILYSYKLAGEGRDWVFNKDGNIHLSDLDYGNYDLMLRAKSFTSKNWIEYDRPIRVKVHSPIHKRWWFIALVSLLVFGLIYISFKLYTKQLRKKQAALEQIVAERTAEIRFQAEGLKLQAEELKSLDKIKTNFFTNISHELKTPITLILGPLSYILDSSNKLNEAEVKNQLHILERNAKNLERLVQEILDLSKLEANKMQVEEVATNLNEFITYVISTFEPQMNSLGIRCELYNQVETSMNVLMDRSKVEKIFNNYISNAIKYTQNDGLIKIEIKTVADLLEISVKDNGEGIHEKDLPYVFDRFFQTKFGEHKLLGGTGIGLALVKELAELMNGKVEVKSEIGIGSTFSFSFPIVAVPTLKPVLLPPVLEYIDEKNEDVDVTSFAILIVEDNEDMRAFIKELLSNLYENIFIATNGEEALKILKENEFKIDLVITDVMMPKVNGLELFKHVRSAKVSSTIPFIMLTALASERDKLASLLVGVDDYLTKPFSVPELLARVNNLLVNYALRKESWLDENEKLRKNIDVELQEGETDINDAIPYDEQFVLQITDYIEANLIKEDLSVDSLARAFFVSKRTLHRKLKTMTGLTPNRLIKEVQLQKARKILEEDQNILISDVAHQVGFHQRSTFAIHFKKRFGIVPSKYKRE